jgi:uncharacterized membrane protein YbhN (UPF0104 family)
MDECTSAYAGSRRFRGVHSADPATGIVGAVQGRPRIRPAFLLVAATGLAVVAVLLVARATGVARVGRAFTDVDPGWIGLIAGAEVVAYVAYTIAYRSLAQVHGHAPLAVPVVARVVVAGFGPFSLAGGFGIDRQALQALHEDEEGARVRVLALGVLEWAVLAPTTAAVSIVLLAQGADIMGSLLWPWAIAVPLGFAFGLWASVPGRIERLSHIRGRDLRWLARTLAGVGVLHTLLRRPRFHAGAWLGTALYWAADIAAFYGGLRTFGLHPGFGRVILAYSTGYAATRRSLPLGGAGITEVLMTYSLYWVHQPLGPALAAVVAYRAFNFLLAATPGLLAHRQLQPLFANHGGSGGSSESARDRS